MLELELSIDSRPHMEQGKPSFRSLNVSQGRNIEKIFKVDHGGQKRLLYPSSMAAWTEQREFSFGCERHQFAAVSETSEQMFNKV
jgi:hypothetical protein